MANKYVACLKRIFNQHKSAQNAAGMSAYLKDQFDFLGIKTPLRQELSKKFLAKDALPQQENLETIVLELWKAPEREYQYFAVSLMRKMWRKAPKERIKLYEKLVLKKSWWDTVDMLAGRLAGDHFSQYPELISSTTGDWIKSDSFWLQRSAILFQLHYKGNTDLDLLFNYIMRVSNSKEFFIQKAIGWVLREYSKTDPDTVVQFVQEHELAPLSVREALKIVRKKK